MRLPHLSWGRVVGTLVLAIACLQIIHMVLLSHLENKKTQSKRLRMMRQLQEDAGSLYMAMRSRLDSTPVLDSSGQYSITTYVYQGKELPLAQSSRYQGLRQRDVTLISHCSVHLMPHLVELSHSWQGPMSVAIFAPGDQATVAADIILKLYQCLPAFQKYVAIHMVRPLTPNHRTLPENHRVADTFSCNNVQKDISDTINQQILTTQNYALGQLDYPNNLLRNVALESSMTEFTMVIDIDMVPSNNLRQELVQFLHRSPEGQSSSQHPTVFIVPAFEIQREVTLPQKKEDLLKLWDLHLVRPFYFEACWKCQKYTDYESWKSLLKSHGDTELTVGYEVEWKDPWEPFYVGPWDAPRYDERFKQYGFNRISQVKPPLVLSLDTCIRSLYV